MTTHAPLSPSSAHRYMRCPGSVREQAKYPEKPSGPGAIDGTHTHTLLEACLVGMIEPLTTVGSTMTDHEGSFVVDADRAKRVQVAVDYARSIKAMLWAERKVNPAHLIGREDMSGTVDIQVHAGDTLHVIDYKDGMNEVEVEGNEQLELYALGVLAGFKLPINGVYPFNWVTMTIIQPKLAMKGLKPITSHTMSVTEVLDLIPKYVVGGAAVDNPDAPLVPGDKQCKYCRASGCTVRAQDAFKMFNITFPQVPEKEDKPFTNTATLAIADLIGKVEALPDVQQVSDQVAAQDPASMTSDQLRQILEAAPLMRQTIEQAEAEAQRRLESGQSVPGLKLVYGRGSQAWSISEDQVVEKLKGMGVPKDAVYKTSVVSPAQAKNVLVRDWWKLPLDQVEGSLLRSKIPKKKVAEIIESGPDALLTAEWTNRKGEKCSLSIRQLELLTRELVEPVKVLLTRLETEYIAKLGGKLTVALESDPRAAVVRDAAPLFSAVEVTPETPALPSWLS